MITDQALATVKKSKLLEVLGVVKVNPLTAGPECLGNSLDGGAVHQSQSTPWWVVRVDLPAETGRDCFRGVRAPRTRMHLSSGRSAAEGPCRRM